MQVSLRNQLSIIKSAPTHNASTINSRLFEVRLHVGIAYGLAAVVFATDLAAIGPNLCVLEYVLFKVALALEAQVAPLTRVWRLSCMLTHVRL